MVVQGRQQNSWTGRALLFSPLRQPTHKVLPQHAGPICPSLGIDFCIPGVVWTGTKLSWMGGSQRLPKGGTICYEAKVGSRSSLKAAQLLRVLFLWKNFLALLDLRGSCFVWFCFFSFFSHHGNYLLNQWQYNSLHSKNNQTLVLYLDFQLSLLIVTCRFPGTAANYFLPWSFHGLLPFCVSLFLCRQH